MSDKKKVDKCAFCGRTSDQVEMLLQGGGSSICVDCALRVSEYVHYPGSRPHVRPLM